MSIRIHNEGLSGASAPETSRAQELARTGTGGKSGSGSGSGSADQVHLSSLSETLATNSVHHASRVEHLKAVYAAGRYQVNAAEVSHAIVNNAIQAGAGTAGNKP